MEPLVAKEKIIFSILLTLLNFTYYRLFGINKVKIKSNLNEKNIQKAPLNSELFLIKNKLFGIHVRGHPRTNRNKERESLDIIKFLNDLRA
jgi:hypothetical protein